MSRRSRRRQGSRYVGTGKLALIALLLVIGVTACGYAGLRRYLHSDRFRQFLSAKASRAAQVEGQFAPFRWDGLAVETLGYEAQGEGMLRGLRLEGLHTEIGLGGLRRGVWEMRGSRIQRLEMDLDLRGRGAAIPPVVLGSGARDGSQVPVAGESAWLPREVDLQGLDVRHIDASIRGDFGAGSIQGMRLRLEPAGKKGAYQIEIADGLLRAPIEGLPELRLQRGRFRFQDGALFVNHFKAHAWEDARLEVTGECQLDSGRYTMQGQVSGVKCQELLSDSWAKRCSGVIESDFSLQNDGLGPALGGHLRVNDGVLTALPVLDVLAAYADTRRFRILTLSEAHTQWHWRDDEWRLEHLVLASEGLVRIEGSLRIRKGNLDGDFKLGLAPGILAKVPGAETHVFHPGERGLLWTPLRVTGTLADPREDLSERLIAAAGQRMFDVIPETGERALKFTRSLLNEPPSKVIDRGIKVIDEGRKTLREVEGILGGVLGGPESPPERELPELPADAQ